MEYFLLGADGSIIHQKLTSFLTGGINIIKDAIGSELVRSSLPGRTDEPHGNVRAGAGV